MAVSCTVSVGSVLSVASRTSDVSATGVFSVTVSFSSAAISSFAAWFCILAVSMASLKASSLLIFSMPFVRRFAVTLFGIARTCAGRKAFYANFCVKHRVVIPVEELFYQLKGNLHFVFLAPFDKFGFEVNFLA